MAASCSAWAYTVEVGEEILSSDSALLALKDNSSMAAAKQKIRTKACIRTANAPHMTKIPSGEIVEGDMEDLVSSASALNMTPDFSIMTSSSSTASTVDMTEKASSNKIHAKKLTPPGKLRTVSDMDPTSSDMTETSTSATCFDMLAGRSNKILCKGARTVLRSGEFVPMSSMESSSSWTSMMPSESLALSGMPAMSERHSHGMTLSGSAQPFSPMPSHLSMMDEHSLDQLYGSPPGLDTFDHDAIPVASSGPYYGLYNPYAGMPPPGSFGRHPAMAPPGNFAGACSQPLVPAHPLGDGPPGANGIPAGEKTEAGKEAWTADPAEVWSRAKKSSQYKRVVAGLEKGSDEIRMNIANGFRGNVVEAFQHSRASIVVRTMITTMRSDYLDFFVHELATQPEATRRASVHRCGSRTFQRMVEAWPAEQMQPILDVLLQGFRGLIRHESGNWIFQTVIAYGSPSQQRAVSRMLAADIRSLAVHQFGCRVVQKAMFKGGPDCRDPVLQSLLSKPDLLISAASHQHGHLTVAGVLKLWTSVQEVREVRVLLQRVLPQLQASEYGKVVAELL